MQPDELNKRSHGTDVAGTQSAQMSKNLIEF